MTIGPVQLLVIGFDHPDFHGQIQAELDRLRESDTIRLIDLLFIRKDAEGNVERLHHTDLSESESIELGATVGALIGFGADGEEGAEQGAVIGATMAAEGQDLLPEGAFYVDDTLPPDTAAAVALIEHRWAIGLRELIREAGGFHLADSWIHPLDLVAIGLMTAEEAELAAAEQHAIDAAALDGADEEAGEAGG
jgi:uncharacterized membrane protein